ncbi:type II secretion system F family protein [Streptomyces sp. NPDC047097]|uniref:type II secretion system F family protein n=1 Tax=Streptomyces sp. NPDC047097 TaxID=3155260 RepID=UPI0034009B86
MPDRSVYAAVCAGAAAWLLLDRGRARKRAGLLFAGPGAPSAAAWPGAWRRWWPVLRARPEWLCLLLGAALALAGESPIPVLAGAAAVPLVGRRLRARARARMRDRRADAVVALCGAIAGELRAGAQPAAALRWAARATEALGPDEAAVLAAARFGGDVPETLRQAARREGADGLAGLAACWQVAVDGGAGLAGGLDRLEAALREHRDQRERLRAQLAGAWATATLLALLPVAGLAMGCALGADPLEVLLHTPAGLGCLVLGGLLEAAGLCWAARLVRGAVGP